MPQVLSSGLQRKSSVGASRFRISSSVSVLLIQSNQINIKLYPSSQNTPHYHFSLIITDYPPVHFLTLVQNKLNRNPYNFDSQHITYMRREILLKARKDSVKNLKEPLGRTLERSGTQIQPTKTLKKLNAHMRSRTRNLQQFSQNGGHPLQTPGLLPKIGEITERIYREPEKSGLDSLQEHLHRMLIKNLKKCKENRNLKLLEDELGQKRQNVKEKEVEDKKQGEKNRLEQLRSKLSQLYGDLATEQNKLSIQYSLEQKMERRYNAFHDKITHQFRKNTVDTAQNTDPDIQKPVNNQPHVQKNKIKAITKLRAAAYAVYFSLFFPRYTRKFHEIRRKYFQKKIHNQKVIQSSIQECYKLFELMKLRTFWKQLQNSSKSIPEQTVSAILSEKDSTNQPIQYSFKIEQINSLLQFVLSHIRSAVKTGKIDNLIKNMSQAFTNQSYIAEKLFLESELLQINVNDEMEMRLKPNQQKTLLVNFVFIKLVAFSFMMNNSLVSDGQSNYIFDKQKSNKFENLTFSIAKQLLLCGIYLIRLCSRVNKQSQPLQDKSQGNIEKKQFDRLPLQMPQLEFKSNLSFLRGDSKRVSIQESIEALNSEDSSIFVKNIKNLSKLLNSFRDNSQKQLQFLAVITEIRDQIYSRLMRFKKQTYQKLKNFTFEHLNRKHKKQSRESQLIYPQRNEEQKAVILSYCKYFSSKRPQEPTVSDPVKEEQETSQKSMKQGSGKALTTESFSETN